MLGIKKLSAGRMGNRLFHYHFLRQIAAQSGIDYFHPRFPEARYFEAMDKKPRPFSFFRKQVKISSLEIRNCKPADFLKFVAARHDQGYDMIFQPPLLGEVFFDYLFYPPAEFLKIKKPYQEDWPFPTENKTIVGLHFRGTDFAAWDSRADLKFPYYQKSIQHCLAYFSEKKPIFVLFTDDLNFPAYRATINYLQENQLEFHLPRRRRPAIYDFYQLGQCEVIISSPSTFAILAACQGRSHKKIIHNQDWLDYRLAKGDPFWANLYHTQNPYYSLWRAF